MVGELTPGVVTAVGVVAPTLEYVMSVTSVPKVVLVNVMSLVPDNAPVLNPVSVPLNVP
jgi:hypothetical protein